MNRFSWLAAGLGAGLVLLLSGCASTPADDFVKRSDRVENLVLRTRGEPGQHFTAKLDIDGKRREISGLSPFEVPLEACVLSGTVRKNYGEGTLGFQIVSANSLNAFGNLTEPGQSCWFRYHARGVETLQ